MKFLTDENVASFVVKNLRLNGFDVKDIKEERLHGSSDKILLNIAQEENRIIITHDKDFSNFIRKNNQNHNGVILTRSKDQNPSFIWELLTKVLNSELKNTS